MGRNQAMKSCMLCLDMCSEYEIQHGNYMYTYLLCMRDLCVCTSDNVNLHFHILTVHAGYTYLMKRVYVRNISRFGSKQKRCAMYVG
jgi:hypothetical protein